MRGHANRSIVLFDMRIALLITLLLAVPAFAESKPIRIASLGLCTDQVLLMLVDRSRIVTINHQAANPVVSYMAAAVGDIPLNQGTAEEIIPYQPDLILSTAFASPDAARMLKTLGYRVEFLPLPTTVAGIRDMLLLAGGWLGETEKAQALIAEMDATIRSAQVRNQQKPARRAIIYSPNGYTIGADTLEHDVLKQSGYRNLAAERGVMRFQQISLETLVTTHPERILIDNYAYNQNSLAYSYVNHPAVRHLIPEENRVYVPSRLRDCAGPQVAEEIAWLADHR
jgi:iron complex transport system substrate-binding protein